MSNVEIVKVLLQYIGNDLEQDKAIAQGAVILLDAEKAGLLQCGSGDEGYRSARS